MHENCTQFVEVSYGLFKKTDLRSFDSFQFGKNSSVLIFFLFINKCIKKLSFSNLIKSIHGNHLLENGGKIGKTMQKYCLIHKLENKHSMDTFIAAVT